MAELEAFLRLHLDTQKIKYEIKERVYTIKFTKDDAKRYGEVVKGTFDMRVANKEKVPLFRHGTYFIDTLISPYLQEHVVTHLKLEDDKDFLNQVNEKLPDLKKKGSYNIDPKREIATYLLFEVIITSGPNKIRKLIPLLIFEHFDCLANGVEDHEYTEVKTPAHIEDDLKRAKELLPDHIKGDLKEAEELHDKHVKELIAIAEEHAERQYQEIQMKENVVRNRIEELKGKSVAAASFQKRSEWMQKARKEETKLQKLQETNATKRETIKKNFDNEATAIRRKGFNVDATVVSAATIDMPYFVVKFEDKMSYAYLPASKKFISL